MTASGRRVDRLSELEEHRDFLLASLDDLDREHELGELSDGEYRVLRDDYVRRTAEVARAIEAGLDDLTRDDARRSPWWAYLVAVAVLAVVAGVSLAQAAGQRTPGGTITGEIDESVRTRLARAETLFLQGRLSEAREEVDAVLIDDRDLVEAQLLSAQIHVREGEIEPALRLLDTIVEGDPEHIDALTLRGWVLVNLPPAVVDDIRSTEGVDLIAEGIASLDAAIALEPTVPDPYMFRGVTARVIEGDLPLAIDMYRRALELGPPPAMVEVIEGVITEMEAQLAAG